VTYRPRLLKRAKTPMTRGALRYFLAPRGTADDFYACIADCDAGMSHDDAGLYLYYDSELWRDLWQQHCATIEAEWRERFPHPEELRAQRAWACQSYDSRLREIWTKYGGNRNG
jgi:hypothetical protein